MEQKIRSSESRVKLACAQPMVACYRRDARTLPSRDGFRAVFHFPVFILVFRFGEGLLSSGS